MTMSRLIGELSQAGDAAILEPDHPDYPAATSGYQLGYRQEPDAVVLAAAPDDVRHAIRVATAAEARVTVQATGHGLPGDRCGGVLVDTRRMNGVTVHPLARTAVVQAGARWSDVIARAAVHGLAPLSGSAPSVGAVGYTLEGGVGLLSRQFGYAADHVLSLDIVTADGALRTASPAEDPELYWALRGGGGNFGIVTAMTIALFPVERFYGGGLYFADNDVERILHGWAEWTAELPPAMNSSIGLIPFPDRPTVPDPLRGRYAAHVRVAHLGTEEQAEELLAPLRALATPVLDTLRPMTYDEAERIYDDPPTPMAYYATNVLVPALTPLDVDTVLAMTGPGSTLPCVLQVNHLGGALAEAPAVPGAVAHRPQQHAIRVLSRLAPAGGEGVVPALREGHDALYRALGVPDGELVLNFLLGGPVTTDQVRRGYHPEDFVALARLKHRYDPGNVFSGYHAVPPLAA
jgi:hypothetical protein